MEFTFTEKVVSRTKSQELLERLKKEEQKITFHARRINKNTVVYCKNEDRLSEFEKSYNNIKMV